jgi:hypothetical protein
MKQKLIIRTILLLSGVIVFSVSPFLNAGEEKELDIEKQIQELRSKAIDPAIIEKRLTESIQAISKKIQLSPEEQAKVAKQMKKLQELIASKKHPDLYTQSQAQVTLPNIRRLIAQNYNITPYLNVIASALAKEGIFKRTHYVFYHAQDNVWRVPQELYRRLYERLNPIKEEIKDFVFLRWNLPEHLQINAQKFIVDQLINYGLINDNHPDTQAILLSANLALFGNVGFSGECTWDYFVNPSSHKTPAPSDFEQILDIFNIDHKYTKELVNLAYSLRTKEQTLLQIFIPKEIVDYIAYVAFLQGIPADKQTMNWVLKHIPKKLQQLYTPYKKTLEKIRKIFKTEQDKFPIFKELYERAEQGDFSVDALLKIYCNTPQLIENINYLQARLIFTKEILLTPGIGIKFFRYDKIPQEQLQKFNQALDALVDQMIQDRLTKSKNKPQ